MPDPESRDKKQPLRPGTALIMGGVALTAASALTGGAAMAAAALSGVLLPYGVVSSGLISTFRSKSPPPPATWPEEAAAYDPPASPAPAATPGQAPPLEPWRDRTARTATVTRSR
jgi:hypothetical protein